MKRAGVVLAVVGFVLLGTLASRVDAVTFVDLPCKVETCQGTEQSVEEMQGSFSELVDMYVASGVLSPLKAEALSELLYSSLESAEDSGMKCVADNAFARAVNLVKALAPQAVKESPSGAERLQGMAKRAFHSMSGVKPASRQTNAECVAYLGGIETTCDSLACAYYRNSPNLWSEYMYCCNAYWGSWSDIMCF